MANSSIMILAAMCLYLAVIVGVGIFYAKRANESTENYFLGGRTLGPWVTAFSAEASDMSGWLLMGLPGVAYWSGISDAAWTAIGLLVGTYLNWLIVSKRLRRYSIKAGNAITLPDFFSNRFKEKSPLILTVSAAFILIFFAVYCASCLVTCGKLFSTLFGLPYAYMMLAGAVVVLIYTMLGGFLAESVSDFIQAIVMIVALLTVLIVGTTAAGGIDKVISNATGIPGFLDFFGIAKPSLGADELQQTVSGRPLFLEAGNYGLLTIVSTMAWGLGYFGMPQVLLRFMAIRKEEELKSSRRIAVIWCAISLFAAVVIGVIGRALFPTTHLTAGSAENIFITLSQGLLPTFIAGIVMSGILAATMSSSDSYMLIAASAFSKNIYERVLNKKASDKNVMLVSRITILAIALFAIIIAWDENSRIFELVSFAWAGFGATFGPLMLFSLFWKRTTRIGGFIGMITGGVMVFVWKLAVRPLGGIVDIYELLPAFLISCLVIYIVSKLTPEPAKEIQDEFDAVRVGA
ncbi:MAG: sodium/proline symporter PutP [Ruminococcus sp.]|jgi:sodium/proline symporter|nr:sodium/proline symporter PutP [Ruminococcus sp.]